MEQKKQTPLGGLNGNALRAWGLMFLLMGVLGRGILQNQLLGVGVLSGQQLLESIQNSRTAMFLATAALVLQALETCAVPIYAFLLTEGFSHTGNFFHYLARIAALAVFCEIPYNLAMGESAFAFSSLNPVFGMLLSLVLLYFFRRYEGKSLPNVLIKSVVLIAALLWATMLSVESGIPLVLMVSVLWFLRKRQNLRTLVGATVSIAFMIFSPFFLAAPLGFMTVHFYNGDKGADNRLVNYLSYPVLLLLFALVSFFI